MQEYTLIMTRTHKTILAIATAVIVILIISKGIKTKEVDILKLGLMSPLSGEYAVAGQNYQKGIQLAFDEFKKAHPDTKIELTIEDDGFDVKKGIAAYKKLTSVDHVEALMTLSTPVIDAIYPDINATDLIVMQLGIQTKGVAADNIFQTSPLPESSLSVYTEYLNSKKDFKKIAVVYDNTAGGISFYNTFKQRYTKEYISMIVNAKSDIRPYATKIAQDDSIDAVLFLTSPDNGALLTKDLLMLDKTVPQLVFDAQMYTGYENYKKILGDMNKINGSISMWLKDGDSSRFKELYKAKYKEEPGFLADFGYDTFNVLIANYDSDHAVWVKRIQSYNDKKGASGSISFDAQGVRLQDIVINTVEEGKLVPVQ